MRPTFDRFLQYLETLERLAIKCGKNGIDVIVDMGSFGHIGKEQESVEWENRLNIMCVSKCSILCCYHNKDLKALGSERLEEIHKSHLKNYVVKEQE